MHDGQGSFAFAQRQTMEYLHRISLAAQENVLDAITSSGREIDGAYSVAANKWLPTSNRQGPFNFGYSIAIIK